MARMRSLNQQGILLFRSYLADLRAGRDLPPPTDILTSPDTSAALSTAIEVRNGIFATRRDAGEYLTSVLAPLDRAQIDHNPDIWNWLALFYFNQLCPPIAGHRKPGQDYRYILPPVSDADHFRHYYRHLLAGAYTVYRLHPSSALVLLCGTVEKFDDFNEQLASRQEFVSNPGIIEAADLLYFDSTTGKPKRGAASNKRRPGTLRRFVDVIQQFELTYDLHSLSGRQILPLLPEEFRKWNGA